MIIGNKTFACGKTYIMGILNVTPDSFSDGGKFNTEDAALFHVKEMIEEGADVIDIGGESTRPGSTPITTDEEIERVVPILTRVKSEFDIPVSVDTYRVPTAKESIKAGADLINDVWGLQYDPEMAVLIASAGCACCIMHNRKSHDYTDFANDFVADNRKIYDTAVKAGISKDRILLDPGIGFAKTVEENLWVLNNLDIFNEFDVPYLLGCSRKSVIGKTLDLPVDERLEGTLATTALAVEHNALFVRVHDVKENLRLINMLEAVRNAKI